MYHGQHLLSAGQQDCNLQCCDIQKPSAALRMLASMAFWQGVLDSYHEHCLQPFLHVAGHEQPTGAPDCHPLRKVWTSSCPAGFGQGQALFCSCSVQDAELFLRVHAFMVSSFSNASRPHACAFYVCNDAYPFVGCLLLKSGDVRFSCVTIFAATFTISAGG